MATVILEYGPNAAEAIRVGLAGELRADVDNDSLRLHDGVKPGGYEFLNRDQNDGRYQARSLELDGFNFGAQGKGILTRVGPAQYKLRRLKSASGDITFVNPVGTAGDFDLRLSDEITTEHIWDEKQTFLTAIDATEAGLDGETRGEHVGHGDNEGFSAIGQKLGISPADAKRMFAEGMDGPTWQTVKQAKKLSDGDFGDLFEKLQATQMAATLQALDASHSAHPGFSPAKAYIDLLQNQDLMNKIDATVNAYGRSSFGSFLTSSAAGGGYRDSFYGYTQALSAVYTQLHELL